MGQSSRNETQKHSCSRKNKYASVNFRAKLSKSCVLLDTQVRTAALDFSVTEVDRRCEKIERNEPAISFLRKS